MGAGDVMGGWKERYFKQDEGFMEGDGEELEELGCMDVNKGTEGVMASAKKKGGEETRGRHRDEWDCDFCGLECFCGFQRFSL
jgi:hypothetical protein